MKSENNYLLAQVIIRMVIFLLNFGLLLPNAFLTGPFEDEYTNCFDQVPPMHSFVTNTALFHCRI